jgi:ribonuclease Z
MSARELVVLGTNSQVPTRYRNHNGYLLLWDGIGFLFDPGEGTQRQMLLAGVSTHQIHRICLTHFHGDHCLGLPGVLQRISLDGVPHEVSVHFPGSGQAYFERLRYASIYLERGHISPVPHQAAGEIARVGALRLTTARLSHGAEAWGYRLEEADARTFLPDKLAAAGVRGPAVGALASRGEVQVGDRTVRVEEVSEARRGQVFTFLMDTRPCAAAVELARGADMLVAESTYLSSEAAEAHAHGHMTAADAGRLAAEAGARTLVLTHFSQRYPSVEPFVAEAKQHHPEVIAAVDLLRIDLPPRRR